MSGTLAPMSTGVPAGTHKNFKILGTAGYRVPRKFLKLGTAWYQVPRKFQKLGTGYRENFRSWASLGTGYRGNFKRLVRLGTGDLTILKDGYRDPRKFKNLGTFRVSLVKYKS